MAQWLELNATGVSLVRHTDRGTPGLAGYAAPPYVGPMTSTRLGRPVADREEALWSRSRTEAGDAAEAGMYACA